MKLSRVLCSIALVFCWVLTQSNPSSAQSGDDKSHLTFLPLLYREFDPEFYFSSPNPVELLPAPPIYSQPYIIIDSRDRTHILWETSYGNDAFIYHTYQTGEGWSEPSPVAESLGRSELLAHPAVGINGKIQLIWFNQLNSGGPYRILYSEWDGQQWGSEHVLLSDGKSIYISGMIRQDTQGTPNVITKDGGLFQQELTFYRRDGSSFSMPLSITEPPNATAIWLDKEGGVHFFGDDYFSEQIHYSYWKAGEFLVYDQLKPGAINNWTTFLDGDKNLHLFKVGSVPIPGGTTKGITHGCINSEFEYSQSEIITGYQTVIASSWVSSDERLQPIIAWSQNDNQTIGISVWKGCNTFISRIVTLPDLPDSAQWGDFQAVARSEQTQTICLLLREKYSSTKFWVECS